MIDLESRYLEEIHSILQQYIPDCEIRVFGSRIDGTARPYSDLDIALVGEQSISQNIMEDLKDSFAESNLPIQVDIADWHRISVNFREIIGKNYICLGCDS